MSLQYSENILLLGAGFTKNFGGLLANEMWAEIFSHKAIQNQPRIKKLMLNDFDYEYIYYSVLDNFKDENGLFGEENEIIVFDDDEKKAIQEATSSAYLYIDEILIEYIKNHPYPTELSHFKDLIEQIGSQSHKVEEFIDNHDGKRKIRTVDTENKSFIFTLNQDLLFERLLAKNYEANISIPGIVNNPDWFTTRFAKSLEINDYCKLPDEDELKTMDILHEGNYFLIKLHGSCNWLSFDGSEIMVIGSRKKSKILKEPLLKTYFEIFENVLSQKNRRLFIIGYGFRDKHINEIISDSITKQGLKIYIITPESPRALQQKLCKGTEDFECSEDTVNIWRGIAGYSQFVEDILINSDFNRQAKKKQFYKTFFD
jgi:hypothetical protein